MGMGWVEFLGVTLSARGRAFRASRGVSACLLGGRRVEHAVRERGVASVFGSFLGLCGRQAAVMLCHGCHVLLSRRLGGCSE